MCDVSADRRAAPWSGRLGADTHHEANEPDEPDEPDDVEEPEDPFWLPPPFVPPEVVVEDFPDVKAVEGGVAESDAPCREASKPTSSTTADSVDRTQKEMRFTRGSPAEGLEMEAVVG
jgi:hypothetical protein